MINKVLLVDDDADDIGLLIEAFNEIDPSIICYVAKEGKAVLENLETKEFDQPNLIFLDINMPGMSGWECLTNLKNDEKFRVIPVIIYSTSSSIHDMQIAKRLGASDFQTKPSNYKKLRILIGSIVERLKADFYATVIL